MKGYDVLMQNFKNGINASKELMEFIKERSLVEESYSKSLHRLHKSMSQVPEANLGCVIICVSVYFSSVPCWCVIQASCSCVLGDDFIVAWFSVICTSSAVN